MTGEKMKLFLASQDLGNYAEVLKRMVGEKKHAFVISNARDYYGDEVRIADSVKKTIVNLNNISIEAERLDIKSYFGKQQQLADLIKQKQSGLIFSIGGSVACLATALHASGLDEIIRQGTASGDFVYGGYSAGAMVAGNDLSLYELDAKPSRAVPRNCVTNITREIYNLAPHQQGLGLISQYILPHMDRDDHIEAMRERLTKIRRAGVEAICLNDSDVFIVDGNTAEALKAELPTTR